MKSMSKIVIFVPLVNFSRFRAFC